MALNDWADREHDGATRADRPIPSGAIHPGAALALGVGLSLLGPLLSLQISPEAALVMGAVAGLSLLYNLGVRGAASGPLLLGACRAGNLLAGMVAALALRPDGAELAPWHGVAAASYGLYVLLLSCLARHEDAEAEVPAELTAWNHPRSWLLLSAAVLALAPLSRLAGGSGSLDPLGLVAALGISAAGASGLVRRALAVSEWSPGAILGSMGMGLRRLLVVTAALAATQGLPDGLAVASAILLGYPVSFALRKLAPPS